MYTSAPFLQIHSQKNRYFIIMLQPEQDPPVYYSIVILTILYYLRVADLDEDYVPIPT